MQHMVALVVHLTTACSIRHVRVSVPLVEPLIDGVRYFRPDDLPPPAGVELRALSRPRIAQAKPAPASRPDRKAWRKRDLAEFEQLIGRP